MIAFNSEAWCS